jgi:hypothetical protein
MAFVCKEFRCKYSEVYHGERTCSENARPNTPECLEIKEFWEDASDSDSQVVDEVSLTCAERVLRFAEEGGN